MGHGEEVPPEILKTLVGWKKHFNSYTQKGRFNVRKSHLAKFFFLLILCQLIFRLFVLHLVQQLH